MPYLICQLQSIEGGKQTITSSSSSYSSSSLSSSSSSSIAEEKEDYHPSCASGDGPSPKRERLNIMSRRLSSALDRTNVSSRNATFIVSEVASSLRLDVTDLNQQDCNSSRHGQTPCRQDRKSVV